MTQKTLTRFKPYDIRGEINVNIDETISYGIGRADAHHFNNAETNDHSGGSEVRIAEIS